MTTTIHLEYEGKSARLPLQSPKRAKTPPLIQRRTSTGGVVNVRIFNAARRLDARALSAEEIVSGDPELDFMLAGSLADPDLLSGLRPMGLRRSAARAPTGPPTSTMCVRSK